MFSTLLGLKAPLVLSRRVDFELSDTLFSKWKYNHPSIKKILCVSDAIARIVRPHLREPEKCITVHSGIDIGKFSNPPAQSLLRKEYALSEDTILIGNTSALAGHKDYFTFIDTVEILTHRLPSIKAFIIGKGPLENELKAYVAKKKLTDHIIFTGFRKNIIELLPSLDIFLITSTEEGLGTSILDAFAARVPVIATEAGGIPEMVKHLETGMLAKPKDSKSLASYVEQVANSPELRKSLVDKAYKKVLTFSKEQTATKTLSAYEEIVFT